MANSADPDERAPVRALSSGYTLSACTAFVVISRELRGLSSIKKLLAGRSDDTVDKLHNAATSTILFLLATLVTTGLFVGDAIRCWLPANFPENRVPYVHNLCWIKNTYYIPMDDVMPVDVLERKETEVTYYQWVPLILLFMAFLFKVPYIIWRQLHRMSGVNISRLTQMTEACISSTKQDRENKIEHIAELIDHWLSLKTDEIKHNKKYKKAVKVYKQTYLIRLYIFVKVLYFVNVVGHLYVLKEFLGLDYPRLGYDIVNIFSNSEHWVESERFPRLTMCDFQIRNLQNVQRYTVQCVLPINLFNEKIFVVLWVWMILLSVLTGISLFYWVWNLCFRSHNFVNIRKYLKKRKYPDEKVKRLKRHLGDDGCFMIRMVSLNTDSIAVKYLLDAMMKQYLKEDTEFKKMIETDI